MGEPLLFQDCENGSVNLPNERVTETIGDACLAVDHPRERRSYINIDYSTPSNLRSLLHISFEPIFLFHPRRASSVSIIT